MRVGLKIHFEELFIVHLHKLRSINVYTLNVITQANSFTTAQSAMIVNDATSDPDPKVVDSSG